MTRTLPALLSCLLLGFTHLFAMPDTPASPSPATPPGPRATAYLGGGCFWCVEAIYQTIPGVHSVVSGFAGGGDRPASYKEVCSGKTGHAEVVRIEYDPAVVDYATLLAHFWDAHDPTTPNRQGADVGSQYRSIILYLTPEEKKLAEASKRLAQAHFEEPIVTQIAAFDAFHPAEAHHQDYYRNNSSAPYCRYVIKPKLEKFLKSRPALAP